MHKVGIGLRGMGIAAIAAVGIVLLGNGIAGAAPPADDRVAKAQVHGRPPSFCTGCPERPIFAAMKLVERELGSRGITANVVAPGFVDSDMTAASLQMLANAPGMGLSMPSLEVGDEVLLETFDPLTMSSGKARVRCVGEETITAMGQRKKTKVFQTDLSGIKS
ncbi:hypothetical protein B4Q13_20320, partial [Lacticaseibacillus rhamnosus]